MTRPEKVNGQGRSPGEILLEKLKDQEMSQVDLATLLGRSPQYVSDIVKGKKRIDPLVAMELEEALDDPDANATFWLAKELAHQKALQRERTGTLRRKDVMEQYPFALEAVRQAWFPDSSNPDELLKNIEEFLSQNFEQAGNFRTGNVSSVEVSVKAWHIRVVQKAFEEQNNDIPTYTPSQSDQLLLDLKACMQQEGDVVKVKEILNRYGIRFVIVPHLRKAPVDGIASYNNGKPYIGLSLRNGQLDRFWFTLMHEVAHIIFQHSKNNGMVQADNIDQGGKKAEFEIEADQFSRDILLPSDQFDNFANIGEHSLLSIQRFAAKQRIHPSIVIGRLKFTGWLTWSDFAREHPSVRDNFAGMIDR